VFGSDPGMRVFFAGMTSRFVPEKAAGASGEIQYELTVNGSVKHWVVRISEERASARPGRAEDPRLVVGASVSDWVRMAAQDLEPARALMTGRLRLEGDFLFASRLGEMFGAPSPY
jgi:putative sterol carrier protein